MSYEEFALFLRSLPAEGWFAYEDLEEMLKDMLAELDRR